MLASVFCCIIIVLLTYYTVFKQGFFPALLNTVAAVIAAVLAVTYGQQLAAIPLAGKLGGLAQGVITLVFFIVANLVLREILDRVVRGNMVFPQIIDRAASAVCGLIFSTVVVGVLALGFQMLPIGAEFLMYDRYGADPETCTDESGLFPYADAFVVSLTSHLSGHSLAGANNFSQHHPDFLRELYLNRVVMDPGSRQEAAADALGSQVTAVLWNPANPDNTERLVLNPPAIADGEVLLLVPVKIRSGAGDADRGARDVDGKIRFVMGNFRLFGYDPDARGADPVERYPLGMIKEKRLEDKKLKQGAVFSGDAEITLLFAWPHKKNDPTRLDPKPLVLEFKRSARAEFVVRDAAAAAQP